MPTLAGTVDVDSVMDYLRAQRPVFHSEADFQHAFGQVLHELDPTLKIRLEVPQSVGEVVDLLCFGSSGRTLVEFKHFTAAWRGLDPHTGEQFALAEHAAADLARRNFVFGIHRLERFCRDSLVSTTGLAVLLSNSPGLWSLPRRNQPTRDQEFRIHQGRTLAGSLRWGGERSGFFAANQRDLSGIYAIDWRPFSELDG
jgi:hypothetical protein